MSVSLGHTAWRLGSDLCPPTGSFPPAGMAVKSSRLFWTWHTAASALSYFSCGYGTTPGKSNLKEEGLVVSHRGRAQSILVEEKTWWREGGAAGHMAHGVRKQEEQMLGLG